jgi:thiol-disulfide isomerase/thioredoxin
MTMTTTTARQLPTAHPYDDTDVIDARAPRFNQATIGLVSLVALVTGWWGLLAVLALQLAVGLRFGRRWCLPCVAYFRFVQPRIGEGRVEDARPPRFANLVGVVFLTAASVAYLVGLPLVGAVLGGAVAALALLSAVTGFCTGCEAYKLLTRLRGVRAGAVGAIDLAELGAAATTGGVVVVQFTHPLCSDCHELERRLAAGPRPLHTVDVSRQPDLARRYHVAVVPTAFAVAGDGTVLERLA